jgi:hypothetical protein
MDRKCDERRVSEDIDRAHRTPEGDLEIVRTKEMI